VPITGGYGLYHDDVNPGRVAEPAAAHFDERISFLVWSERRYGQDRISGARVEPEGLTGSVTFVDDGTRVNTKTSPSISVSGEAVLFAWTEGVPPGRHAYGNIWDASSQTVRNFLIDPREEASQSQPIRAISRMDGSSRSSEACIHAGSRASVQS
jgi:hypothetical protein